jgi:hypothetical protein
MIINISRKVISKYRHYDNKYPNCFLYLDATKCTMNHGRTTILIATAIITSAVLTLALAPLLVNGAYAAISPRSCTNGGGNQPGGQQPTCKGGGLTQEPATNPAGSAPPGQNK